VSHASLFCDWGGEGSSALCVLGVLDAERRSFKERHIDQFSDQVVVQVYEGFGQAMMSLGDRDGRRDRDDSVLVPILAPVDAHSINEQRYAFNVALMKKRGDWWPPTLGPSNVDTRR